MDYDNTAIYCRKYDCKKVYDPMTQHTVRGYYPGVSFVDGCPVHIEGRDGNAVATFKIKETIQSAIEMCHKNGVKINMLRSDSAGYNNGLMEYCDENNIDFVIRTRKLGDIKDDIEYGTWDYHQIASHKTGLQSVRYTPTRMRPNVSIAPKVGKYRVVIQKTHHDNGDITHRAIITNNWKMSDKAIVEFYNQRGDIERRFDDLKNQFNWKRLPFSFLHHNTTFMIISAMAYNMYQYCLRKISKKVPRVQGTFRLKAFIDNFIKVSCEWVGDSLILYSDRDYPPLSFY